MKQQIRFGAFETNSSSTHSLTMGNGTLVAQPFDKKILRAGVVTAHPGDYGWEYYRYFTAREKLDYLVSQLLGNGRQVSEGEDRAAVFAALAEASPRLQMLAKVVKDYTGCTLEIGPGTPSIDHDSVGVGYEAYESEAALKQFLFDETAYVQTGNDNSPAPFIIATDKGERFTYEDRICNEVPGGYVPVRLRLLSEYPFPDGFGTETGGLATDEEGSTLFKRLCAKAVVARASVVAFDSYSDRHEGQQAGGRLAGRLFGDKARFKGLRVLPTFGVQYAFNKVQSYAEHRQVVHLDMLVSPRHLAELQALPAGGVVSLELKQARRMLKHSEEGLATARAEGKADAQLGWETGMLKGYSNLVKRLSEEQTALKRERAKAARAAKRAPGKTASVARKAAK